MVLTPDLWLLLLVHRQPQAVMETELKASEARTLTPVPTFSPLNLIFKPQWIKLLD